MPFKDPDTGTVVTYARVPKGDKHPVTLAWEAYWAAREASGLPGKAIYFLEDEAPKEVWMAWAKVLNERCHAYECSFRASHTQPTGTR